MCRHACSHADKICYMWFKLRIIGVRIIPRNEVLREHALAKVTKFAWLCSCFWENITGANANFSSLMDTRTDKGRGIHPTTHKVSNRYQG
jgi:hypothetical protein